jgi:hypothetical protein
MPDGANSPVSRLLHEFPEALHTTGLYLGTVRRLSGQTPHVDIVDKASSELSRAATAFRHLRDHLTAHESGSVYGSVGQSPASEHTK